MMTFNAGLFNQPGAPSQVGGAPGGAQANPAANASDEAAGADFAALLTGTWSTPLNPDFAEPAEERGGQEPSDIGSTDEQPAMPVALIGPPVQPLPCRTDIDATTPAPGSHTEAAPVIAFSITNLFTDKSVFRTGAETANAGDGTTAETNMKEVNTGTTGTASPVASDSDEFAEPALAASFKPQPKPSPQPRPMPVTPAAPAITHSFNGDLQRNPVLRPFPRVPQNELTTTPQTTTPDAPADIAPAHYSPYSDADGIPSTNPTQAARPTNVFTILGLKQVTDSIQTRPLPATERIEAGSDVGLNPGEKNGEKSGKASILETMFREVARVAAESQAQTVAVKDAPAVAPRISALSPDEHGKGGNAAETVEAADAAPGALTTGHAISPHHLADAPTSAEATALAKQVVSPLLEMARDLTKRETRTLRLQLRPEEFGHINLQITRGGDGRLSAQLAADLSGTQTALAEGINHLRQTLEHAGLAIDRLEVNLALDLHGKGTSHTAHEEAARTAYGQEARTYAAEPVTDAGRDSAAEQRRLLNLRI